MPRPMIKNSQFKANKIFLVCLFLSILFHEVQAICLSIAYREYQTLPRKASDRENLQRPHHFRSTVRKKNSDGQVNFTSLLVYCATSYDIINKTKQNSFRRLSLWNNTVITYGGGSGKILTMLRIIHFIRLENGLFLIIGLGIPQW